MSGPPMCRIYYSCNNYPDSYMDVPISRWDENDYDLTIETFLGSGNRNVLFDNLKSVGEIYEFTNTLGWNVIKDRTYNSGNSLILEPLSTGLSNLRDTESVVVKNISDTFLTKDKFSVKLECKKITDWDDF